VSGDGREGRLQGVLGARLQQCILAVTAATFRLPVHGLHHPREGPVPLEDESSGIDGRASKLLKTDGRVASERRERADIHRQRVSAQPDT
jgi:hypothetical protein